MAKIPARPEEVFEALTSDYKTLFGADLVSIILFGSGARGQYVPGKSDLNFLIVLTDSGMVRFGQAADRVAAWRKRNLAIPLMMTETYIASSVDVYPIEFLNMQLHHVTVFGKDVLAGLTFGQEDLRLQVERELKGKLLLLRRRFFETEGKEKAIRGLIGVSMTAFLSVFGALLSLKDAAIPGDRPSLIAAVEDAYGIDRDVFQKCLEIKAGRDTLSKGEIPGLFHAYVREIGRLCDKIDEMKILGKSL